MGETRCPHGFMRSIVPCVECGPLPVAPKQLRKRVPGSGRNPKRCRLRGDGEPNKMRGEYTCTFCRVTRPLSEFYLSRTTKQGHQSRCKDCDNNLRGRGKVVGFVVYDGGEADVLKTVNADAGESDA